MSHVRSNRRPRLVALTARRIARMRKAGISPEALFDPRKDGQLAFPQIEPKADVRTGARAFRFHDGRGWKTQLVYTPGRDKEGNLLPHTWTGQRLKPVRLTKAQAQRLEESAPTIEDGWRARSAEIAREIEAERVAEFVQATILGVLAALAWVDPVPAPEDKRDVLPAVTTFRKGWTRHFKARPVEPKAEPAGYGPNPVFYVPDAEPRPTPQPADRLSAVPERPAREPKPTAQVIAAATAIFDWCDAADEASAVGKEIELPLPCEDLLALGTLHPLLDRAVSKALGSYLWTAGTYRPWSKPDPRWANFPLIAKALGACRRQREPFEVRVPGYGVWRRKVTYTAPEANGWTEMDRQAARLGGYIPIRDADLRHRIQYGRYGRRRMRVFGWKIAGARRLVPWAPGFLDVARVTTDGPAGALGIPYYHNFGTAKRPVWKRAAVLQDFDFLVKPHLAASGGSFVGHSGAARYGQPPVGKYRTYHHKIAAAFYRGRDEKGWLVDNSVVTKRLPPKYGYYDKAHRERRADKRAEKKMLWALGVIQHHVARTDTKAYKTYKARMKAALRKVEKAVKRLNGLEILSLAKTLCEVGQAS